VTHHTAFYRDVKEAVAQGPCPICGGPWKPRLRRHWHRGHPAWCQAELRRRRQDEEAQALRGDGGIVVNECGCSGTEHSIATCTRLFAHHPDAEIGMEYGVEEVS
jgi:hypothetical protein